MKRIEESRLAFYFDESYNVIKFDEDPFYREYFNKMSGSKGVDFLAESEEIIHFIEVKNCLGTEQENRWRTSINNGRIDAAPRGLNVDNRNSFDIEVAQKVAMSICCLFGSWTKEQETEKAVNLADYWRKINSAKISKNKKQILKYRGCKNLTHAKRGWGCCKIDK